MNQNFLKELISSLPVFSSDIHFTIKDNYVEISYRSYGKIHNFKTITLNFYEKLIRYIKYNSNLDITDEINPQSGKLEFETDDKLIKLRVSCIPSSNFTSLV